MLAVPAILAQLSTLRFRIEMRKLIEPLVELVVDREAWFDIEPAVSGLKPKGSTPAPAGDVPDVEFAGAEYADELQIVRADTEAGAVRVGDGIRASED